MAKQYGAVSPQEEANKKRAGYGSDPAKAEPKVKQEDPSPPTRVVDQFHKNASVDTRPEDIHHRIGRESNQAASGSHTHNGADSPLLLENIILTGSRGGNTALASVIGALVQMGAKDSTTP